MRTEILSSDKYAGEIDEEIRVLFEEGEASEKPGTALAEAITQRKKELEEQFQLTLKVFVIDSRLILEGVLSDGSTITANHPPDLDWMLEKRARLSERNSVKLGAEARVEFHTPKSRDFKIINCFVASFIASRKSVEDNEA